MMLCRDDDDEECSVCASKKKVKKMVIVVVMCPSCAMSYISRFVTLILLGIASF